MNWHGCVVLVSALFSVTEYRKGRKRLGTLVFRTPAEERESSKKMSWDSVPSAFLSGVSTLKKVEGGIK